MISSRLVAKVDVPPRPMLKKSKDTEKNNSY